MFKLSNKHCVGLRTIKTSLAVLISLMFSYHRVNGLPFYSGIAAILCMEIDYNKGLKVGVQRIIGTLIGSIYSFLFIKLALFLNFSILEYSYLILISFFIIPIIHTNVLLKQSKSAYISCVVFLSISIAHGYDANPMIFAFSRFIDTIIGISVSILINKLL